MSRTLKLLSVAILLALMAVAAGCHKKVAQSTPPPPPPPPSPTVTLAASPAEVQQGQPTSLTWSSQNANSVTLEGVGAVDPSGTRQITPTESTTYRVVAKGPGGEANASARVTVSAPPPPPPAEASPSDEALFEKTVKDIFFDYDKYNIRASEEPSASTDAQFLASHSSIKVLIEGHCDNRGSAEYNIALGDSRANETRNALVKAGVPAERLRTVSYGKERPFCNTDDEQCWQLNRRAHFVIDR